MSSFDVIIIGAGPTGKLLARQLSDTGHCVAIVERWPAAYPLPRAVGYDHEIKRMFHSIGLADEVEALSRTMNHYVWYNADWKVLVDLDETREAVSGGAKGFLFNQPELERVLEADLEGRAGVSVFFGHEASAVTQTAQGVEAVIAPFDAESQTSDTDKSQTLSAKYIVGCDGANSIVREQIGSDLFDHGFDAQWLVVDFMPNDTAGELPIPDAAQWCNPDRPTTIVPSGVNNRRWEFMVKPGENPDDLAKTDRVWELLSPWVKPEDGELVRSVNYRFRSQLAQGWRKGRMLIAGDAAHLMPPFMGQGMCSGLRDAWNLGWKLDLILSGKAPDTLLDDYEVERSPHVDTVIRISMAMGQIVCVSDPEEAAARDAAFFSGNVPPPPEFPGITAGLIDVDASGVPKGVAGQLAPHSTLGKDGEFIRMDNRTGRNFTLITNGIAQDQLSQETRAALQKIGAHVVCIGGDGSVDKSGRTANYLTENGIVALLVRPDFYSYGAANSMDEIDELIVSAVAKILKKAAA